MIDDRRPMGVVWAAALGAAIAIAQAAGCGVGLGGTGTGAAAVFQASPASVCGSDFAGQLDCPAPTGAQTPSPAGTPIVRFVDASGLLVLEIEGNDARLDGACQKLHFDGSYGTRSAAAPGFFGVYTVEGIAAEGFAALSVAEAGAGGLTIELRDAAGQVLIGLATLQRASGTLPAPGPC